MLKELQDFGLSENEARVYLASLEIGKATADEISKHANVKRPTTYVQIESLMQKGLMSSVEEGKKTYFAPESPEYLKRLFEQDRQKLDVKNKELERVLPDLEKLFTHAGERPRVRFFDGKEGIRTMREEFLKVKSKELFVIFSQDVLEGVFGKEELTTYSQRRAEAGIHSRAIYTHSGGKFKDTHPSLTERRFIPENKLSLETDIIIFDNKIALTALRGKLFGVIIESKEIAKSIRSVFEILWESAESNS